MMFFIQRISVMISLFVMLIMNALAVLLPLNQVTTKELSDSIPTYVVPAGYVFGIWSLIYLALAGYAVYQMLPASRHNQRLRQIAWYFVANALANALWIVLWHYRYVGLSVGVMCVILLTLIMIYVRLQIGVVRVGAAERWLVHFPFSLYLGWISVATIANVAAALYVYRWNAFGISSEFWSVIMMTAATLLAIAMMLRHRDYVYAAVIVWAVVGIAVHYPELPVIKNTAYLLVLVSILAGIYFRFLSREGRSVATQ